ncbi:MAG: DUF4935 domain-containing protein [Sphingobacteriaceae bacterium]|nr:DUF4935 domain-containing protein [Sphingobacteriaceae bacterium]
MYYICLDTNAWIYLVNGMEPVKLLHFIEDQVELGTITLLVPELTVSEWNENKGNIKQAVFKELNAAMDNFERITKAISRRTADAFEFLFTSKDDHRLEEKYFDNISNDIKANRAKLEDAIGQNIISVEKLFEHKSTIRLPTTAESKMQAADLALQKKAPFLKKNSFADATILMVFCNYLRESGIDGGIFISYNSEDYCLKENKSKSLHPHLAPFIDDVQAKFYIYTGEAMNSIEQVLTEQELSRIREIQEEWEEHYCEVCTENRRYSSLYFSEPFDIDNENNIGGSVVTGNELSLNDAKRVVAEESLVTSIQTAQCSYCGVDHFLCQKCGSVNALWDDMYNERIECEGCGIPYIFEQSYDYHDGGGVEIRIPKDLKLCQGCNDEFEELSDSGLCVECEEEYATGD